MSNTDSLNGLSMQVASLSNNNNDYNDTNNNKITNGHTFNI